MKAACAWIAVDVSGFAAAGWMNGPMWGRSPGAGAASAHPV